MTSKRWSFASSNAGTTSCGQVETRRFTGHGEAVTCHPRAPPRALPGRHVGLGPARPLDGLADPV